MNHIDTTYMQVESDGEILYLFWKEKTADFTDEDFKIEARTFIKIVKKLQSKKILVDMRNFRYELSEELIEWRGENIISVYNQIGVKKFAFISDKPAVKQDNPENTFVTRNFRSLNEAVAWLSAA